MIDRPFSTPAAFFATTWGKLLTVLAAISILMGIAIEAQMLVTGYYAMKKTAADMQISQNSISKSASDASIATFMVQKTLYEAQIAKVNADYAKTIGKYP
jgi:hypothetical protein